MFKNFDFNKYKNKVCNLTVPKYFKITNQIVYHFFYSWKIKNFPRYYNNYWSALQVFFYSAFHQNACGLGIKSYE